MKKEQVQPEVRQEQMSAAQCLELVCQSLAQKMPPQSQPGKEDVHEAKQ
jgi:hypothetical protein